MSKHKVKIYTTPTCVYCSMAKKYFQENKVDYSEVDVTKDRAAANEMIEKSGQMGVPVIDVDGKIIVGFDRPALKEALGL
ncbi:MAG: Uxx-star family glutaredoxin-like (seleno)protein [Candidatus Norongarragalinales archaeon]